MPDIVILTGAGLSAESGVGTFRDKHGLWTRFRLEDVATPEGFARNPHLVHEFYNARRENCLGATFNSAHAALARLEQELGPRVGVVTQNIDDLHERAGSRNIIHMHGQLLQMLCASCGESWPAPDKTLPDDPCPHCKTAATRPDVVWFGEIPYHMDKIAEWLSEARIFAAIGTSGTVWPAAGFVEEAAAGGARTIEMTLERSEIADLFDDAHQGTATELVPRWVDELLAMR